MICCFLLLASLDVFLQAQQPTTQGNSYPDNTQNPASTVTDCNDPTQANSIACSADMLNPVPQGSQLRVPQPSPQWRANPQGLNPNGTLLDTDQQLRQTPLPGQTQQNFLPPEPLTELQKFVASTSGQILPIYGANLFRRVPSTFAPLEMSPVPSDYVVGPGDELRVRVWGQVNFQANLRVDRSGEIFLPQVGSVHVASLPFSDLDSALRKAIGRVYHNFDLIVNLGQIRSIQVYLTGQARNPGVYTVSSLSSLVDALFASGGPSTQGSLREIELRRGGSTLTHFDLYAFLIHGDKSKDVKLLAGDVIFIPAVGPQAAVTGSVRSPAIYELRANETLGDLIADAGEVSATASRARISIERIDGHNGRHAMEAAYDSTGLATPVVQGDLVRVFSIVPMYNETVTIRGNIANPGRFAWHSGMRIGDLIPDKDSLITRNYWWRRAQLGLPAPEFEPIPGFANLRQPPDGHPVTMPRPQREKPASMPGQPGVTQPGDLDTQNVQLTQQPQQTQQSQQMLPQQQTLNAQQRSANSSLASQQPQQTLGRMTTGVERTEVYLPAPDIDWAYADILRLDSSTLKTSVIPFDLGKLVLEHDQTQNLELKAGDVISIFSEDDIRLPIAQQTKLVKLEGEFVHSGLYSAQPGETLRDLVARAGGLTPNAYLYGAEFTRESTRVLQQARIDEYLQSLDLRIQRSNLAIAAAPLNNAQDIASGASAQASERELLTRLRQIRASGRVVLEFKPDSTGIGVIPTLTVEDGDRFVVPSVPATVNVVGAVNDQNSFLFSNDKLVGGYLKKAGGATQDADMKRSFVIRADGEVVGYSTTKNVWGSNFNSLKIYPGDTIVVPEKTFKPSPLRGVLEWSQLFSQFALGAASIAVIAQ